jgi:hypothetical protein
MGAYDLALTFRNNMLVHQLVEAVKEAIEPSTPMADSDVSDRINQVLSALSPHLKFVTDTTTVVARAAFSLSHPGAWEPRVQAMASTNNALMVFEIQ